MQSARHNFPPHAVLHEHTLDPRGHVEIDCVYATSTAQCRQHTFGLVFVVGSCRLTVVVA